LFYSTKENETVEIPPKKQVNQMKQHVSNGVNEPAKKPGGIQSHTLPCAALALCEA